MKWRNQLLALFCLLAFAGIGVLYFQHWVIRKPFGIIQRLELAVREVRDPRAKERELKHENRNKGDREIADRELPLFEVHARGLYAACAGTATGNSCALSFTIRCRTHPLASCPPMRSARSNKLSRPFLGGDG